MQVAVLVFVAITGLLIGSFLNVVIWRVPQGLSVVRPPSACPRCGHRIGPLENIPVLSWLVLRGKCKGCAAPISVRYPLVELGTALAFAAVALRFKDVPSAIPAFVYLAAIGVALAMIDLDVHRLPDVIVKPAYPIGAALLAVATAFGDQHWAVLIRAGVGGLALFGLYFLLVLVKPGAMGWGDVKLAGVLGMYLGWVGWGALAIGAFGAFFLGGLWGIAIMAMRNGTRRTKIPFGPWMILAAALAIGWGESLFSAYLTLFA